MLEHRLSVRLLCIVLATQGASSHGQTDSDVNAPCGPLYIPGRYGPYDFRTDKQKLPVVVNQHFTPAVEQLRGGNTSVTPGGDIAFTLRAIPNHPNALTSMMLLGEKEKTDTPSGAQYSIECWFERAIRFRQDDHIVRMIYASYLTKKNRRAESLRQLDFVLASANDNAFTHYNIGLLYFDLGEYERALAQAHQALKLGLNRPELRTKLENIGKWFDSAPAGASTNRISAPVVPAEAAPPVRQ